MAKQNFFNPNTKPGSLDGITPVNGNSDIPADQDYQVAGGIAKLKNTTPPPASATAQAGDFDDPQTEDEDSYYNDLEKQTPADSELQETNAQSNDVSSDQPQSSWQDKKEAIDEYRDKKKEFDKKQQDLKTGVDTQASLDEVKNLVNPAHDAAAISSAMASKANWTGEQLLADSEKRVSNMERMYEDSMKKFGIAPPADEGLASKTTDVKNQATGNVGKNVTKDTAEHGTSSLAKDLADGNANFSAKSNPLKPQGEFKKLDPGAGVLKESDTTVKAREALKKEGAIAKELEQGGAKLVVKDTAKAAGKSASRLLPGIGLALDAGEFKQAAIDIEHGQRPDAAAILDGMEDILSGTIAFAEIAWASMLIRLGVKLLGEDEEEIAECLWPKETLNPFDYYAANFDKAIENGTKLTAIVLRIIFKLVAVVLGLLLLIFGFLAMIIYIVITVMFGGISGLSGGGGGSSSGNDNFTPSTESRCAVITDASSYCSPDKLAAACNWNPEYASRTCNSESRGNPASKGTADPCKDTRTGEIVPISVGLFQIAVHNGGGSAQPEFPDCKNLFTQVGCAATGTLSSGSNYCKLRLCNIPDMTRYKACLSELANPERNIKQACNLYQRAGNSLKPWFGAKDCKIVN